MSDYVTKAEVKTYMDIKSTDTSKDGLIDVLIPAAQSFIEEHCNQVFESVEVTEYHTGGSNKIFLKKTSVDKTKTITVYDDWDRKWGEDTLIPSTDYFVDGDTGIITFDYVVGGFAGAVKVTYTGGSLPNAIKQACIELVARKVKEGTAGALGVPSRSIPMGGGVTFVVDDLLPQTRIVLEQYRRMPG